MPAPLPSPSTIAVMTPGDMGSATAARLIEAGHRVITCLAGRSERTHRLAQAQGIETVADHDALASEADLILSILVPSAATDLARALAAPVQRSAKKPVFVDMNAVAPATVQEIATILEPAGAVVVDGGIIGPPPRPTSEKTRFYLSGDGCEAVADVLSPAIDARALGGRVGDASSLKMCYAASTKGAAALGIQLMVAAERLGVRGHLEAEFGLSRPQEFAGMQKWIKDAVPKAFRWIGEMEEIAATFESVGVTPSGFQGAAATYSDVAGKPVGSMRVEEWAEANMDFDAVIEALAEQGGKP